MLFANAAKPAPYNIDYGAAHYRNYVIFGASLYYSWSKEFLEAIGVQACHQPATALRSRACLITAVPIGQNS